MLARVSPARFAAGIVFALLSGVASTTLISIINRLLNTPEDIGSQTLFYFIGLSLSVLLLGYGSQLLLIQLNAKNGHPACSGTRPAGRQITSQRIRAFWRPPYSGGAHPTTLKLSTEPPKHCPISL